MEQIVTELKQIDDLLFEEFREVSEFEAELFNLEYELDEEEKLVAKLHNACHTTILSIKHLHSLIRRLHKSPEDKTIPVFKKMIKRQIEKIEQDVDEISPQLKILCEDERAGEKIAKYCKRIEGIIRRKLAVLKERFNDIEQLR